jgi:hypothetical protein
VWGFLLSGMTIKESIWKGFSRFVSWGMGRIPRLTVWSAENAFLIAPKVLRGWVDRYTSERILACVVGGELPFIPGLNGGDALLFYPLPQCERYELIELPHLKSIPLFGGAVLAIVIPKDERLGQYHLCGYDSEGHCFDAGLLFSRGVETSTQVREGIRVVDGKISWDVESRRYLTSFLMMHSDGSPHAAGYSRRKSWDYPSTRYLPHVVIEADGTSLESEGLSAMLLVVDTDAWVPEILIWKSDSNS